MLTQQLSGFADLTLAWKKHEYVAAARLARKLIDGIQYRLTRILFIIFIHRWWPVANFNRIQPARDFDNRRGRSIAREMRSKAMRVDSSGSHYQLQIGSLRQQTLQIAEQEIDVQTALMRFIDDQRVIRAE